MRSGGLIKLIIMSGTLFVDCNFVVAIGIRFGSDFSFRVNEPDDGETTIFNSSVIMKNRRSEQTFFFNLLLAAPCSDSHFTSLATGLQETPNAAEADFRFDTSARDVLFPPELQNLTVQLTIFGDSRVEGNECFLFLIWAADVGPSFTISEPNDQIVTIEDNGM